MQMSVTFSDRFWTRPLLRRCTLAAAGLLILLVLLDMLFSGPIRVYGARGTEEAHPEPMHLVLPFKVNMAAEQERYRISFRRPEGLLDAIYKLTIRAQGCLEELRADDKQVHSAARNCKRRELIIPLPAGERFELTLSQEWPRYNPDQSENMRPQLLLSIQRQPILSQTIATLMGFAALYCLLIAMVDTRGQAQSLHWGLLIATIALLSVWRPYRDIVPWLYLFGVGIVFAALAYLLALAKPVQHIYGRIGEWLLRVNALPQRYMVGAAMLAFLTLSITLTWLMFDAIPHIGDSHTHYAHSKIFASGQLYQESHPFAKYFDFQSMINNGKFYGVPFPGHTFLLALGQRVSAPWLVNPIMGTLTLLAIFLLTREIAGRAAGYIACALTLFSPVMVVMSVEFMSHVSVTCFLALFLFAYIRQDRTGSRAYCLLAGTSMGCAVLIRPQSTIPFVTGVVLHALWRTYRHSEKLERNLIIAGIALSFMMLLLFYNYQLTGNSLTHGYNLMLHRYYPQQFQSLKLLEFLSLKRWYTFIDEYSTAIEQLQVLHKLLFGWPTSSLWCVVLLVLIRRLPPYGGLLLSCFGMQFLALIFIYRDNGTVMLPRYISESAVVLIALSAAFIAGAPAWLAARFAHLAPHVAAIRGGLFLLVAAFFVLAIPQNNIALYRYYSNTFFEGNWYYDYMIKHSVKTPALVFVRPYEAYRKIYFNMPPRDDAPIIFAMHRRDREELMNHYPDRYVYEAQYWHLTKLRDPK